MKNFISFLIVISLIACAKHEASSTDANGSSSDDNSVVSPSSVVVTETPSPTPNPDLPTCEVITPISASYYGVEIPIYDGQLYEQFSCNGNTVKKIFPFPGVEDWCAQYTTPWEGEYNICVGYPIAVTYTATQVCLEALFYVGSATTELASEVSEYCGTTIDDEGGLE